MTTYAEHLAATMSEATLQSRVKLLARTLGWLVYHTHDSRRSDPGFPDLTLVRSGRLVFAELKRQTGRVTTAQHEWLEQLAAVPDAGVYLWRPLDLLNGTVERVLRGTASPRLSVVSDVNPLSTGGES